MVSDYNCLPFINQCDSSCVGVPQGQHSSYYPRGSHLHLGSVSQWFTWDLIGFYGYFMMGLLQSTSQGLVNPLRPRPNGCHFADDMFKCIFLNENIWIPIEISLKFVPKADLPALTILAYNIWDLDSFYDLPPRSVYCTISAKYSW